MALKRWNSWKPMFFSPFIEKWWSAAQLWCDPTDKYQESLIPAQG